MITRPFPIMAEPAYYNIVIYSLISIYKLIRTCIMSLILVETWILMQRTHDFTQAVWETPVKKPHRIIGSQSQWCRDHVGIDLGTVDSMKMQWTYVERKTTVFMLRFRENRMTTVAEYYALGKVVLGVTFYVLGRLTLCPQNRICHISNRLFYVMLISVRWRNFCY